MTVEPFSSLGGPVISVVTHLLPSAFLTSNNSNSLYVTPSGKRFKSYSFIRHFANPSITSMLMGVNIWMLNLEFRMIDLLLIMILYSLSSYHSFLMNCNIFLRVVSCAIRFFIACSYPAVLCFSHNVVMNGTGCFELIGTVFLHTLQWIATVSSRLIQL